MFDVFKSGIFISFSFVLILTLLLRFAKVSKDKNSPLNLLRLFFFFVALGCMIGTKLLGYK